MSAWSGEYDEDDPEGVLRRDRDAANRAIPDCCHE
jgi:hypothetical protein